MLNEAGSSKGAAARRRGARETELQSGQTAIPPEQVRLGGEKYVRKKVAGGWRSHLPSIHSDSKVENVTARMLYILSTHLRANRNNYGVYLEHDLTCIIFYLHSPGHCVKELLLQSRREACWEAELLARSHLLQTDPLQISQEVRRLHVLQ